MAKRKRRSKARRIPDFPPDIFWISPNGKVRDVIGHLTSLQAHPDAYGLPAAPETSEDIDTALCCLFEQGWVRGRYSSGTFSFQMERPRGTPMGNAFDLVFVYEAQAKEVDVDFWDPAFRRMAKSMPAKDFMAQKFPARWGLGRTDTQEPPDWE